MIYTIAELQEMSRHELLDLLYDNVGGMYYGVSRKRLIERIIEQQNEDIQVALDNNWEA